jgi:hypothetical protein
VQRLQRFEHPSVSFYLSPVSVIHLCIFHFSTTFNAPPVFIAIGANLRVTAPTTTLKVMVTQLPPELRIHLRFANAQTKLSWLNQQFQTEIKIPNRRYYDATHSRHLTLEIRSLITGLRYPSPRCQIGSRYHRAMLPRSSWSWIHRNPTPPVLS